MTSGHRVYFATAPERIKIGTTRNLPKRMGALKGATGLEIVLLGTIPGGHAVERSIHKHLAKYRVAGEWFSDCAEVRGVVERILRGELSAVLGWNVSGAGPAFSAIAIKLWPEAPIAEIQKIVGGSLRTIRGWVSGANVPPGSVVPPLLGSERGGDFLDAVMDGASPGWWRADQRARRIAAANIDDHSVEGQAIRAVARRCVELQMREHGLFEHLIPRESRCLNQV